VTTARVVRRPSAVESVKLFIFVLRTGIRQSDGDSLTFFLCRISIQETMLQQLKDEELIRIYVKTQQSACFELLYTRYVQKVYRRCLSLTRDTAKAEDFTHDIFIRVMGNLSRFKEQSTFSTWLYSISYNYCVDQIRQANRTATVALTDEAEYDLPDLSDNEGLEERLDYLARILKDVPTIETDFLRLKYEDGVDIKEIARRFNLKDSAVKMRLKRTRDKIRRLYGPHMS
jgi:RNA polymerase sigma factor (sigma-70 family)